jgi:hypothetical protein
MKNTFKNTYVCNCNFQPLCQFDFLKPYTYVTRLFTRNYKAYSGSVVLVIVSEKKKYLDNMNTGRLLRG